MDAFSRVLMGAFSRVLLDAFSRVLLARLVVPALCRRSCVVARPRRSSTSPRVRLPIERAPLRASLALRSLEDHPKRPFEASRSRGERRAFPLRLRRALRRRRRASHLPKRYLRVRTRGVRPFLERRFVHQPSRDAIGDREHPRESSLSRERIGFESRGGDEGTVHVHISRPFASRFGSTLAARREPSLVELRDDATNGARARGEERRGDGEGGVGGGEERATRYSRSGIVGAKERVDECVRGVAGDDAKVF